MANYAVLKAAINAVIKTNGNKEITGQVLNQTLMAIVDSLGENYQFAGVAVPSTNPGTPDQNIFYLATQAGTYTNFGATVLPAGISMLEWKNNTWSSETFFTIDDAPTAGSSNLVKSGGVKTAIDNVAFSTNEKVKDVGIDSTPTSGSDNLIKSGAVFDAFKNDGGAYDVSVHFPTGGVEGGNTYTLDGAIAMVPQNMRKGGMSIKYVDSSDNKYIQYRLMDDDWSIDTEDWSFYGDDVLVENPEFIAVWLDPDKNILLAFEKDGNIRFGAGVPKQVVDYINEKIAELSLDEYEDIVSFLGNLIDGDKTLIELLNEKVDKVEGKSLVDDQFHEETDSPEYIHVVTDSEKNILSAIVPNGKYVYPTQQMDDLVNIEESFLQMSVDKDGRIIEAINEDGSKYLPLPTNQDKKILDAIEERDFIDITKENFDYHQECIFHDNFCREIEDVSRPWLIGSNSSAISSDKYSYKSLEPDSIDDGFRITTVGDSTTSSNQRLTNVLTADVVRGFRIVANLEQKSHIVVELANPIESYKYQDLAFNVKDIFNYELFRIHRYARLTINGQTIHELKLEKVISVNGNEIKTVIPIPTGMFGNAIRFYFINRKFRLYLDDSIIYEGIIDNAIDNIGLMVGRNKRYSYHFFNIYYVTDKITSVDTSAVVDNGIYDNGLLKHDGQTKNIDIPNDYAYKIVSDSDVVGYGKCERFEIRYQEGLTAESDRQENTLLSPFTYVPILSKYTVCFDFMVPANFVGDNQIETVFQLHESNAHYQSPCNSLFINPSAKDSNKWAIYIRLRSIVEQIIPTAMVYKCIQDQELCFVEPGKWHHFDLMFKAGYIPEHNPLTIVKVDNVETFRSCCPNAYNVADFDFVKYGIYKAIWISLPTNTTQRIVYFDNFQIKY